MRCGGQRELTAKQRKRRLREHGGIVCKVCAEKCGCGRRGCGEHSTDDGMKFCRVVSGEARIDEAWCKEQRKAVAMEEEEWLARFDDEDITSAESEEDDAFYPQH